MNHCYRLIWNDLHRTWVAVCEFARARGKRSSNMQASGRAPRCRPLCLALALAFAPAAFAGPVAPEANALPTGGQVTRGSASIGSAGNVMTINQASQRAAYQFKTFDIGAAATVNVNAAAGASGLFRINDNKASQIYGKFNAPGYNAFFTNPNGFYFAPGSQVNVGSLLATTLRINEDAFMDGNFRLTDPGSGLIDALGSIEAGSVALVGNSINQGGSIVATTVSLVSGNTVAIDLTGNNLIRARIEDPSLSASIANSGDIRATTVTMSAGQARNALQSVVNNTGTVRAVGLSNQGGEIALVADFVTAGGSLDASGAVGGTVNIQAGDTARVTGSVSAAGTAGAGGRVDLLGHNVEVRDGARIDVSGSAGGGRLMVLGDMASGNASVAGTLLAEAGESGNGGFIETSAARVRFADSAHISTRAARGEAGLWLIDPNDFTIAASGGDITGAFLSSQLGSGNVEIQSANGATSGNGDIFVNDAVSWSANKLTLTAERDININAVMTASGTSQLDLDPGASGGVKVGFSADGGFRGRVDFPGRSGTGILTIDGLGYTVIDALGAQGSTTGTDLQGMQGNPNGRFALGSDIDASATSGWNAGAGFLPVGTFTGKFNGLGHTISGLTINRSGTNSVGLFGTLSASGSSAEVRNVGLVGGSVTGNNGVGALVGSNSGGFPWGSLVSHSFSTANVSGDNEVGGLVGTNSQYAVVTSSYAAGEVSGLSSIGGLVGKTLSEVSNSYASGNVTGTNDTGGLVGEMSLGTAAVSNSYAIGTVAGNNRTGGLVGSQGSGSITNSYARGRVSGGGNTGGLIGEYSSGTVTSSYWDRDTTTQSTSARGAGKSSAEMQTAATFTGWDSVNIWDLTNGLYPTLRSLGGQCGFGVCWDGGAGNFNWFSANNWTGNSVPTAAQSVFIGTLANPVLYAGTGSVLRLTSKAGLTLQSGSLTINGITDFTSGTTFKLQTGTLAFNGATTLDNLTIEGGSASATGAVTIAGTYSQTGGTWQQIQATLPAFSAADFAFNGGTFLRATGGDGNASTPYLIADAYGLQGMASTTLLDKQFKLAGDIDASDTEDWNGGAGFRPIGNDSDKFTGSLDGDNKTISGLFINRPAQDYVGLFGVSRGGISKIGLVDASITGANQVGALTGWNDEGTIIRSYAFSTSQGVAGDDFVGGLVGHNGGTIQTSYATNPVSGYYLVGGLAGYNSGEIENSYATGGVQGDNNVGGLVGRNDLSGRVKYSYASGLVLGTVSEIGGLIGGGGGDVINSFWDTETSGQTTSAGGAGAVGKTTAEMKTATTFSDASWDSATIWILNDGAYPALQATAVPCRYSICWDGDAGDFNWFSADNWSGNVLPSSSQSIFIRALASPVLFDQSGTYNFLSLISDASFTMNLASGGLTFNDAVNFAGGTTFKLQGGTLNFNGATTLDNLTIQGGSGSATGAVTVAGTYSQTGGTWQQIQATLPAFSAADFAFNGGTFLRATGGDGTAGTPYLIADAYGLQGMASTGLLDKQFKLAADIDASDTEDWNVGAGFRPIGNDSDRFTGSLDGDGETISGLFINRPAQDFVGLFGMSEGSIVNAAFTDLNVLGRDRVGGLVGYNFGTVSSITATGSVMGGGNYDVGGLVGFSQGTVDDSAFSGHVTGSKMVGGLVGNNNGTVSNSTFSGNVTGDQLVGGLVGSHINGTITNSFYDIDSVLINNAHQVTLGGLYAGQYQDWINGNRVALDPLAYLGNAVGGYYLLDDTDDLKNLLAFVYDPSLKVKLADDIDLTSLAGWYLPRFSGEFHGGGYTLSNLLVDQNFSEALGLVGFMASGGRIDGVAVTGLSVQGLKNVGGLVGYSSGTVTNSSASGSVDGYQHVGGLVGSNYGTVSNSTFSDSVTGTYTIGGLVGSNESGTLTNSFYNIDSVLINNAHQVTLGGLYAGQYQDWINGGRVALDPLAYLGNTVGGYYLLDDTDDLKNLLAFVQDSSLKVRLTGDIDLTTVAGWYLPQFSGEFHGGGYILSNLSVDQAFSLNLGFVGVLASGAKIDSLALTGLSVKGLDNVGGMVGFSAGRVTNSSVSGSVNGLAYVGGLVGRNFYGTVSKSSASGSVVGSYNGTGGVVGYNDNGIISDSSASASVTGTYVVGGLVGRNSWGTVTNSYSTGAVTGGTVLGGLIGSFSGVVTGSFWDVETSGQTTSAGGAGAVGKTTAEMKTAATFIDAGWDSAIWKIEDGAYPSLKGLGGLCSYGICWDGGAGDFNWFSANNWTGNVLPSSSQSIYIRALANPVLFDQSGTYSFLSLISDASLTVNFPGSLTFTDAVEFASGTTFKLQGGTLAFNGATTLDNLTIEGGSASGTGAVTVAGTYSQTGGTWQQLQTTLPAFSAADFAFNGGTFLRATGGNGSAGDPYRIADVYGLQGMASTSLLDKQFKLAGDIDASDTEDWNGGAGFKPIGNNSNKFTGGLDGDTHAISNLAIQRPTQDFVGLFGYANNASIQNIQLADAAVRGRNYVGGLAGTIAGTTAVSNASVSGTLSGRNAVAGIAGTISNASITGSHSSASVSGGDNLAGIAASISGGSISRSYNLGNISIDGSGSGVHTGGITADCYSGCLIEQTYNAGKVSGHFNTGGIAGKLYSATIRNSFNIGAVENDAAPGNGNAGGLAGYMDAGSSIYTSYSTGSVTGPVAAGGMVGGISGSLVYDSFWDIETSGKATSAGGTGKTTAEMKTAATFSDARWDSATIWTLSDGAYPVLQGLPSPFGPPDEIPSTPDIEAKRVVDNVGNFVISTLRSDSETEPDGDGDGNLTGTPFSLVQVTLAGPDAIEQAVTLEVPKGKVMQCQ